MATPILQFPSTHPSSTGPVPITRSLYGLQVPAESMAEIKTIADALVKRTDHREYLKDARRRCALLASLAWEEARTLSRARGSRNEGGHTVMSTMDDANIEGIPQRITIHTPADRIVIDLRRPPRITINTLADYLKPIHPANLRAAAFVLRDWALWEFHQGLQPKVGQHHPVYAEAAKFWAGWLSAPVDCTAEPSTFTNFLGDYGRLLFTAHDYIWSFARDRAADGTTVDVRSAEAACQELERLGHNVGLEIIQSNPEDVPAPFLDPIARNRGTAN